MNSLFLLSSGMDEKIAESTTALIAGMGTVFAILILISVVISLFKYMKKTDKPSNRSDIQMKAVIESNRQKHTGSSSREEADLELLAVLTAAICASLNTTSDQLRVKSYRRISSRQTNR